MLQDFEDLVVDQLGFEALEVGLLHPAVEFILVLPQLLHLLVGLALGHTDYRVLYVVVVGRRGWQEVDLFVEGLG